MGRITLVTGGSRSGKSLYAQRLAEAIPGRRVFIATAPVTDAEMADRVRRHREARTGLDWETAEEGVRLAETLREATGYGVALVDCLTLWVNNLMYEAEQRGAEVTEEDVAERCGELLEACRAFPGEVVLITNEVGMGIVPGDALSRRFRDLAGRCNQVVAAGADAVTLVVCGLPMCLKQ